MVGRGARPPACATSAIGSGRREARTIGLTLTGGPRSVAFRHGRFRARLRVRLGGAGPADIRGLRQCLAAACLALPLLTSGVARAEAIAQLPADESKPAGRPGLEAPASTGAAEPEEAGTRRL